MIASTPRPITYRRQPATLTVMRNDGFVWGRLRQGALQLDVTTRKDRYWEHDEDILDAFERASRNPNCVEDACGWLDAPEVSHD